MSSRNSLPQTHKIVQILPPRTTNGGQTSGGISLKNANKAWIIVDLDQAVGHATALTLKQATDVALGTNAAGPVSPIWANEDCAADDTLAAQTAAADYTVTNDIKTKQVVFEVDPATLTEGYPVVYVTLADSSQATNFGAVTAILESKYQGATQPSAIID